MQGEVIVLIGVSGSGKSTVAKRLAPALQATFLEGDDYHSSANIAKMRAGTPLTDADRWPWLDTLGHAVASHAAQGRNVVAACSALRRAYRDRLAAAARRPLVFMHLTIDPGILRARMQARRQHFMPTTLLRQSAADAGAAAGRRTGHRDRRDGDGVADGRADRTLAADARRGPAA